MAGALCLFWGSEPIGLCWLLKREYSEYLSFSDLRWIIMGCCLLCSEGDAGCRNKPVQRTGPKVLLLCVLAAIGFVASAATFAEQLSLEVWMWLDWRWEAECADHVPTGELLLLSPLRAQCFYRHTLTIISMTPLSNRLASLLGCVSWAPNFWSGTVVLLLALLSEKASCLVSPLLRSLIDWLLMSRIHSFWPWGQRLHLKLLDTAQLDQWAFFWWENNFSLSWVPLVYVVTLRQKLMCPSGKFGAVNLVLVPLVRSLELGPWITWPGRLQLHAWGLGGRAVEIEISLILLRSDTGGPGGWALPYSLALSHPAELWGYGSPESKSSLLAGALIATTCMATAPHLSGELHLEALERAVLLKRLPQQIALGSMAKLEKLPLSQKDQTPWNK